MKKVLLSALAVSVMFVSCNKDDNNSKPELTQAKEKDQKESFAAINEIHSGDVAKIKANLPKVEGHLSIDPFHRQTKDKVVADFKSWLNNYETKASVTASNGVAGKALDSKGKARILNERGIEYFQLAKKGFIGAYQFSNAMTEGYTAMKPGANNQEVLVNAVAYLIGSYDYLDKAKEGDNYPVYSGNEFVKYLNKVNNSEGFKGIGDEFYAALKKAKANVNSKSFPVDILTAFGIAEKIAAIRGVHYLKHGSGLNPNNFNVGEAHEISEGIGFVYSLMFTYNSATHSPYFSYEEVKEFMDTLNLYDTEDAQDKLEKFGKKVAEKFGFEWEKA